MKKLVLLVSIFALGALSEQSYAQRTLISVPKTHRANPSIESMPVRSSKTATSAVYKEFHSTPLSPMVVPSGIDVIQGVQSTWDQQSNGRALHNIQVDPSDPNKIHAVIMGTTDIENFDATWPARRCFYTYSSDGGKTWKTPVELQPTWQTPHQRQGYADMQLIQRNGKYVPVIVCHRYYPIASSNVWTALYLEKGNPGDGNFSQTLATRTSFENEDRDIIWPSLGISADGNTVYVIAAVSDATGNTAHPLQFGTYTLIGENRDTAKFNGWTAEPGDFSGTPDLGLASNGSYRIAVSPTGRIGVAWWCYGGREAGQTPTWPAASIYYSESSDGGATWSPDSFRVAGLSEPDETTGNQWMPSGDFDLWFDGESPKVIYTQDVQNLEKSQYQPNSAQVVYVDIAALKATEIAHADTTTVFTDVDGNEQPYPGPMPNILLRGGSDNFAGVPMLENPTVGHTADGHLIALFQSYAQDDFEVEQDTNYAYGSIYYVASSDAGATWGTPQLWQQGSGMDLRYPQISSWNPMNGSTPTYHVMISMDSVAGNGDIANQDYRFAVNSFGHGTITPVYTAGVSQNAIAAASLSVYPNPVVASAEIALKAPTTGGLKITLHDALGRDVYSFGQTMVQQGQNLSFKLNAHALGLEPGVYFLNVNCGDVKFARQIVVTK